MQSSSAGDSKESYVERIDELPASSSPPASAEDWMSLLPGIHHSQPSPSTAGTELDGLKYWSSDLVDRLTTSMASVYTGSSPSASPSAALPDAAEQQSTYETAACSSSSSFVADLTSFPGDLLQDGSLWSQILLDSASHENLRARPNQDVNDAQYWRLPRQGGELLPSDQLQKLEDLTPWDLALRNFTAQADELQMSSLGKSDCASSFQAQLSDDRLSGVTYAQISEIETWPPPQSQCNLSTLHMPSMNQLTSEAESQRERLNPWCNIKQEFPYSCTVPSLPPSWEQRSNIDRCKFGDGIPQLLDGSLIKAHAAGVCNTSFVDDQLPVQRRASPYNSRFPAPFLSQSSDGGSTFLSGSLMSTQQLQGMDVTIGEGGCAHVLDHRLYDLSADATRRCVAIDPLLQYSFLSSTAQPVKPLRPLGLHVGDDGRESPVIGSDPKRSIGGSLISQHESSSDGLFKRPRVEQANPTLPFKQVRKEKLGDRIATLQQLVSPFGKTDTASVLLEAIGYIKFLQEQVQVLSTPYLKGTSTTSTTTIQQDTETSNWSSSSRTQQLDSSEQPRKDLRSRGLCLVPVSCTLQVASDNGADYWSPSLGSGGYG